MCTAFPSDHCQSRGYTHTTPPWPLRSANSCWQARSAAIQRPQAHAVIFAQGGTSPCCFEKRSAHRWVFTVLVAAAARSLRWKPIARLHSFRSITDPRDAAGGRTGPCLVQTRVCRCSCVALGRDPCRMQRALALPCVDLPRVHQVIPRDCQDVWAEPLRAGRADRSQSRQWNGECPAAILHQYAGSLHT